MFGKIQLKDRAKAMRQIGRCRSTEKLFGVIRGSADEELRLAAANRLKTFEDSLKKSLEYKVIDTETYLRRSPLVKLAFEFRKDSVIRDAALRGIGNSKILMILADREGLTEALQAVRDGRWAAAHITANKDRPEDMMRLAKQITNEDVLRELAEDRAVPENIRELAAESIHDPDRLYRLAESGFAPAVRKLDRDQLIRLVRETPEKDFRGAREEAAALLDEETAVQLLPEIRNDTVRNALIRRIADPRRRCRLGYHDYEDTGESFSRETGDTRSIYSVLRCRVCGCRTNHMEESYKF